MPHQTIPGSEGRTRIIQTRKARIGKRAAKFRIMNTLRYFGKQFADPPLKESTVRTWMMNYKKELAIENLSTCSSVMISQAACSSVCSAHVLQ